MLDRGVPAFPDPDSQGQFQLSAVEGIARNSSVFHAAVKTCRPLADNEPLASTGRVSP
jgi:hypothetical protein